MHPLPCGPVPNRPQTSTGLWPGGWGPLPYRVCGNFLLLKIEVELIYNIVFVSGVQQSDSVFSLKIFSVIGYYKILNIVPYAIQ